MALRFLQRELMGRLVAEGRSDLAEACSIQFTDDGGTVYVHLVRGSGRERATRGRAFVLAWEDYAPEGSDSMFCYRWLVTEARASLRDNIAEVIRWLDGSS
jgi:hypothetical protein